MNSVVKCAHRYEYVSMYIFVKVGTLS
eukprot:COSAG05_NODE_7512_length_802_cov_1.560455_1_plen_26_part_10